MITCVESGGDGGYGASERGLFQNAFVRRNREADRRVIRGLCVSYPPCCLERRLYIWRL